MSLKQGLPTVAIVPQEPLLTLDAFSIFLLIFLLFFLFYKISIILAASKPKEDSSSTEEVKDSEAFYTRCLSLSLHSTTGQIVKNISQIRSLGSEPLVSPRHSFIHQTFALK